MIGPLVNACIVYHGAFRTAQPSRRAESWPDARPWRQAQREPVPACGSKSSTWCHIYPAGVSVKPPTSFARLMSALRLPVSFICTTLCSRRDIVDRVLTKVGPPFAVVPTPEHPFLAARDAGESRTLSVNARASSAAIWPTPFAGGIVPAAARTAPGMSPRRFASMRSSADPAAPSGVKPSKAPIRLVRSFA